MDELERALSALPDLAPSPDAVDRHRDELRRVIDRSLDRRKGQGAALSERDSGAVGRRSLLSIPRPSRRWTLVAVAAAVVIVCSIGVLITAAWIVGDDKNEIATPTESSVDASRPAEPDKPSSAPLCGSTLPKPIAIPDGYRGPTSRAVEDAPTPPLSTQLVLSWTLETTSIEARWPADAHNAFGLPRFDPPVSAPSPGISVLGGGPVRQTPSGRSFSELVIHFPDLEPDCQTLQLTVFDVDPARVTTTMDTLRQRPLDLPARPLVAESRAADAAPAAVACRTPEGVSSPNRGGPVAGAGTYPTPTAALQAFVEADRTLLQYGYVELHLPDGSVAYGRHDLRGQEWVTVIHVAPAAGGWTVDSWDGSGC